MRTPWPHFVRTESRRCHNAKLVATIGGKSPQGTLSRINTRLKLHLLTLGEAQRLADAVHSLKIQYEEQEGWYDFHDSADWIALGAGSFQRRNHIPSLAGEYE